MKIQNETRLDTRQLKTLLAEVGRREQWRDWYRKNLIVKVYPRRANGRYWGRGAFNSTCFRLFLRYGDDPRQIARVMAHEAAHNHGLTHRGMPRSYFGGELPETWEWASAHPITARPEKNGDAKSQRVPEEKLAHAQLMLAKAETRAKRAASLLRRWKVKTRYYERRLAASTVQR